MDIFQLITDAKSLNEYVEHLINFVLKENVDGIVLDWFDASYRYTQTFIQILQNLRQKSNNTQIQIILVIDISTFYFDSFHEEILKLNGSFHEIASDKREVNKPHQRPKAFDLCEVM
uniref:Uncharacterized protein n=1 Tax=Acrobeloides nanus TaxID=290746 RepID=A0A914EE06_9BILA